jgi:hypothetical protein
MISCVFLVSSSWIPAFGGMTTFNKPGNPQAFGGMTTLNVTR